MSLIENSNSLDEGWGNPYCKCYIWSKKLNEEGVGDFLAQLLLYVHIVYIFNLVQNFYLDNSNINEEFLYVIVLMASSNTYIAVVFAYDT